MRRFSFLSTIRFVCPRGQPGPAWLRHSGDCDKSSGFHAIEFVSAVIEWGSHPFPSRTRKLSPRSPMVPGPRIRESRSPLDSRPLGRTNDRGGFSFLCRPRSYTLTPKTYTLLITELVTQAFRMLLATAFQALPIFVCSKTVCFKSPCYFVLLMESCRC